MKQESECRTKTQWGFKEERGFRRGGERSDSGTDAAVGVGVGEEEGSTWKRNELPTFGYELRVTKCRFKVNACQEGRR